MSILFIKALFELWHNLHFGDKTMANSRYMAFEINGAGYLVLASDSFMSILKAVEVLFHLVFKII